MPGRPAGRSGGWAAALENPLLTLRGRRQTGHILVLSADTPARAQPRRARWAVPVLTQPTDGCPIKEVPWNSGPAPRRGRPITAYPLRPELIRLVAGKPRTSLVRPESFVTVAQAPGRWCIPSYGVSSPPGG